MLIGFGVLNAGLSLVPRANAQPVAPLRLTSTQQIVQPEQPGRAAPPMLVASEK